MSSDRDRLDAAVTALETPSLRLAAALAPLRSVIGVLVTGAHPDDEMSAMLAALVRRDGVHVGYACATRGEGGQNAIGREAGAALGALRTREMEEAARRLGIAVHWLNEGPGDPLVDFGFAKTAEASFAQWGRERLVMRLAALIRAEKPDIVWPTFLDVPGQHGHHRAVTQATIEAVRRAADPATVLPGSAAAPWQVAKLYLPAWPGGGDTYDDAAPPPNATVLYDATGVDSRSGLTYAQLGECARAAHASQGMGRWVEAGPALYPLHRVDRGVGEATIFDGLVRRLDELDAGTGETLRSTQLAIDQALAAWPDPRAVEAAILEAAARLGRVPLDRVAIRHRLERKRVQLDRVLATLREERPLATTPSIDGPALSVRLDPDAVIINRAARPPLQEIEATLEAAIASTTTLDLDVSGDWRASGLPTRLAAAPGQTQRVRFGLEPQAALEPGLHECAVLLDGKPASHSRHHSYPHIPDFVTRTPAMLRVRVLDAALPAGARIAYVGGGGDRVDVWLARLGLDVTPLDPARLAGAELARFTTIVIGISALRTRRDLAAALPRMHDWVRAGGHLLTLYHRPIDFWDERCSALAPLAIGTPSLRWRVCDPAAPVTVLAPDHPLLTSPNAIGPPDWEGWKKERGLYFASSWDPAYRPLLAMNDPGEAPLTGALLSGRFGQGRHTHTSLALHHQLEQLVPGALRLMANLVQPAGSFGQE